MQNADLNSFDLLPNAIQKILDRQSNVLRFAKYCGKRLPNMLVNPLTRQFGVDTYQRNFNPRFLCKKGEMWHRAPDPSIRVRLQFGHHFGHICERDLTSLATATFIQKDGSIFAPFSHLQGDPRTGYSLQVILYDQMEYLTGKPNGPGCLTFGEMANLDVPPGFVKMVHKFAHEAYQVGLAAMVQRACKLLAGHEVKPGVLTEPIIRNLFEALNTCNNELRRLGVELPPDLPQNSLQGVYEREALRIAENFKQIIAENGEVLTQQNNLHHQLGMKPTSLPPLDAYLLLQQGRQLTDQLEDSGLREDLTSKIQSAQKAFEADLSIRVERPDKRTTSTLNIGDINKCTNG